MTPPDAPGPRPGTRPDLNAVARIRVRMDEFPDRRSTIVRNEDLLAIFAGIDALEARLEEQGYRRGVEAAIATLLKKSTWLRKFGHADGAPPIERCAGWIAVLLPPDAGAGEGQ